MLTGDFVTEHERELLYNKAINAGGMKDESGKASQKAGLCGRIVLCGLWLLRQGVPSVSHQSMAWHHSKGG